MPGKSRKKRSGGAKAFAEQAEQRPQGLLREFGYFLWHNKKWWLIPILLVLVLFGVLIALGGSGLAPFIYTVF